MADRFERKYLPYGSAGSAASVTPSDTTPLDPPSRGLYIGSGGNLVVIMADGGDPVTFTNVPGGTLLPLRVSYVRESTTAEDILTLE